jgi:ABC-type transport system involved in cytochrome c biogenesis permease component
VSAPATQIPPHESPQTPARRPPRLPAVVLALLRKELLVELRTLESVPGMALFSFSTFVVFHFALNKSSVEGDLAAGILLVTLLFAAMLGINRLFVADEEQGGFDALLLAPVDRSAMLIAKASALGIYLIVLEIVAVPAFALLLLGSSLGQALPDLIGVLAGCVAFPCADRALRLAGKLAVVVKWASWRAGSEVAVAAWPL